MLVVRGTKRFFLHTGLRPEPMPPAPTNQLGEWYANTVTLLDGEHVLFVNVLSRLIVLCDFNTGEPLLADFRRRLATLLERLGVPPSAITSELAAIASTAFGRAVDRSAIGSMSDIGSVHVPARADYDSNRRLKNRDDIERGLATMPHLCLEGDSIPERIVRAVFAPAGPPHRLAVDAEPLKDAYPCEGCGKPVASFQAVSLGSMNQGYRYLCHACCNAEIAHRNGMNFEHPDFQPMRLTDAGGMVREFHFSTALLGDRVAIDAYELRQGEPNGYEFQVIGYDPEADVLELFARLLEKMRRGLAQRHLRRGRYGYELTDGHTIRARLDCDLERGEAGDRLPLLVIDGEEVSWETFGRMLMQFEGFQLRLQIFDKSEEC